MADASLAAAVSNAGGLGLISSINAGTEAVRNEIRKCKTLTDKPFGVNIMLQAPNAGEIAKMVVEEGVKILTTGAGSPAQYMEEWKAAGIKVIPVIASVALALKMQAIGATAVVAEGAESGGHVGELHTMPLVPQVVDAMKEFGIPVIAAGGIVTPEQVRAAKVLGADACLVGSAFIRHNKICVQRIEIPLPAFYRCIEGLEVDCDICSLFIGHSYYDSSLKNRNFAKERAMV